jgi:hypothetical protein
MSIFESVARSHVWGAVHRYWLVYNKHPKLMKLWAPVVWYAVAALVVAMEVRMLIGYTAGK